MHYDIHNRDLKHILEIINLYPQTIGGWLLRGKTPEQLACVVFAPNFGHLFESLSVVLEPSVYHRGRQPHFLCQLLGTLFGYEWSLSEDFLQPERE